MDAKDGRTGSRWFDEAVEYVPVLPLDWAREASSTRGEGRDGSGDFENELPPDVAGVCVCVAGNCGIGV